MTEQPGSPFEPLANRPFAFYPPILNIEHNEWRFVRASWSEILVANTKTGLEVWIPRRYVGEISEVEEPLLILGLAKELEFKAGSVWPHARRLIEMPHSAGERLPPPTSEPRAPAHVHAPTAESRIGRLIGGALLFGLLTLLLVVAVFRGGAVRNVKITALDQDFLTLSRKDDVLLVREKLGPPAEERWRSDSGELQYVALWYPKRAYYVILMGTDRNGARYVGALDRNWRVVHSVDEKNASLLRSLQKF